MHEHIVWSLQGIPWPFGKSPFPSNYPPLSCSKVFLFFSFPILCYWKFVEFSPTKTAELFKFTIGEKIPFFIENNNKNCQKKALVMMNLLCFQTLFKIWIVVLGAWDLGDMGL